MKKLKTNWAPFPIEYSSCSSLKPLDFEWAKDSGIANVFIDRAMTDHRGPAKGNFGWFCESSEILPDIKNMLIKNHQQLETKFQNIFTCDYEIIRKNPRFFLFNPPGSNLPWTPSNKFNIPQKTKMCSMICSPKDMTSGHKLRLDVAKRLAGKVHLTGGAHGSPRSGSGLGPNHDWWRSKEELLGPYRFSIVFENASYSNYYTEKITDCFAYGTIPIYWGSPDIGNDFNTDGIIFWNGSFDTDILTEDLYNSKISAIHDNMERVRNLKSADDILFKKIESLV